MENTIAVLLDRRFCAVRHFSFYKSTPSKKLLLSDKTFYGKLKKGLKPIAGISPSQLFCLRKKKITDEQK